MRFQKIMTNLVIILLIICVIVIAIDMFKVLKINFNFFGMQSSERISSSSKSDAVRYEPTNYIIVNKEDALEEIKKITYDLKDEYLNSKSNIKLFEIANIHKLKNFFYEYKSYTVVKYKLLNIIDDLSNLYVTTKGYDDNQYKTYFDENSSHIEKYYGITDSNEFVKLVKTLSFIGNGKIKSAIVDIKTISFDYDNDILTFDIQLVGEKSVTYCVRADYYKSNDTQVKPYISFKVAN